MRCESNKTWKLRWEKKGVFYSTFIVLKNGSNHDFVPASMAPLINKINRFIFFACVFRNGSLISQMSCSLFNAIFKKEKLALIAINSNIHTYYAHIVTRFIYAFSISLSSTSSILHWLLKFCQHVEILLTYSFSNHFTNISKQNQRCVT